MPRLNSASSPGSDDSAAARSPEAAVPRGRLRREGAQLSAARIPQDRHRAVRGRVQHRLAVRAGQREARQRALPAGLRGYHEDKGRAAVRVRDLRHGEDEREQLAAIGRLSGNCILPGGIRQRGRGVNHEDGLEKRRALRVHAAPHEDRPLCGGGRAFVDQSEGERLHKVIVADPVRTAIAHQVVPPRAYRLARLKIVFSGEVVPPGSDGPVGIRITGVRAARPAARRVPQAHVVAEFVGDHPPARAGSASTDRAGTPLRRHG